MYFAVSFTAVVPGLSIETRLCNVNFTVLAVSCSQILLCGV